MSHSHQPVLLENVLEYLPQKRTGLIVDATYGGGGYSREFLNNNFQVIAFDKDRERADSQNNADEKYELITDSYANLSDQLFLRNIQQVDAVIFDLGVSSFQIDDNGRGFSWKYEDSPLDMRMDQEQNKTAAKILNEYEKKDLEDILFKYGEEPRARIIARQIIHNRQKRLFKVSKDFTEVLEKVYGWKLSKRIIARNFQAIRIAVNNELEEFQEALDQVYELLVSGGRLIVVSFHSLEDRIAKTYLKQMATGCTCPPSFPICKCGKKPKMKILTKKPILAAKDEVSKNIRARSAKMRVGEKI